MINKKIVLHHTAIKQDGKKQFDRVNLAHKKRGFFKTINGFYVGYHYLIEQDGSVIKCRELYEVGCHNEAYDPVAKTGYNFSSIGICLAGNFEGIGTPNEKQLSAVKTLLASLKSQLGIDNYNSTNLFYHKDTKATACAGINMPDKSYFYTNSKPQIDVSMLSDAWHKVSDFKGINRAELSDDIIKDLEGIQNKLGDIADRIRAL